MNPNDREQLAEQLSAYLDGELSEADNARIREIIETSPDAKALLDELRRTVEMVRDLPSESPPDDLYATVVAQLERSALLDGPGVESLPTRPNALRWVKTARRLAVAAIILVAVTIGYITIDSRTDHKAEQQLAQVDAEKLQPLLATPARQKARTIVHDRIPAQPEAPAASGEVAAGREVGRVTNVAEQAKSGSVATLEFPARESKLAGVAPSQPTVLAEAPSTPSPETPGAPTAKPSPDAENRLALKSDVEAPVDVPPVVSAAPLAALARDADEADESEPEPAALTRMDDRQAKAHSPTLAMLVTPQSDQAAWRLLMHVGRTLQQQGVDWSATQATSTDDGMTTLYRFDATPAQAEALADQLAAVPGLDLAVQTNQGAADAWQPPSRRSTRGRTRTFGVAFAPESDAARDDVVAEGKQLNELRTAMLPMAAAPMPREPVRRYRETPPTKIFDVSIRMASPPRAPATQPASSQPAATTSQPTSAPASVQLP